MLFITFYLSTFIFTENFDATLEAMSKYVYDCISINQVVDDQIASSEEVWSEIKKDLASNSGNYDQETLLILKKGLDKYLYYWSSLNYYQKCHNQMSAEMSIEAILKPRTLRKYRDIANDLSNLVLDIIDFSGQFENFKEHKGFKIINKHSIAGIDVFVKFSDKLKKRGLEAEEFIKFLEKQESP